MIEQHRPNGTLRHLLTLDGLSKAQIESLLTMEKSEKCKITDFLFTAGSLPLAVL